jgi:hypothetical protein
MTHPKKLQVMLDRLKWQDLASISIVLCEYQIKHHLDEYEKEDDKNFKWLFCKGAGFPILLGAAMHELIKDKKITYLSFRERRLGDYEDEFAEYKHPSYTEMFVCDSIEDYAEEITPESHAKLLFEIANGDYDESTGEYIGYSGDYAGLAGGND